MDGLLPDKQYFKIGEVAKLVGVEPYVLRYWETEFGYIRPHKSQSRQRLYRRRDIELLLTIKHLLYDKRYTIEGARKFLTRRRDGNAPAATNGTPASATAAVPEPPIDITKTPDAARILIDRLRAEADALAALLEDVTLPDTAVAEVPDERRVVVVGKAPRKPVTKPSTLSTPARPVSKTSVSQVAATVAVPAKRR